MIGIGMAVLYIHGTKNVNIRKQTSCCKQYCDALQKCKGYYNLGVVISVASVQRVLLYPHDYCVQTSHRDSNCYILLPELVVKDCKEHCNHGKPRTDATQITIATLK